MHTGRCSRFIAMSLYLLVFISIVCNIVLYFPGWDAKYKNNGHITEEVTYVGGIVGGGVVVLLSAWFIHSTGSLGSCGNRFGMFSSIVFAAVGVAGAFYSLSVAVMGLNNGPLCSVLGVWTTPFKDNGSHYITDSTLWDTCIEPKGIVLFHIGLFSTLAVASTLQIFLCASQIINGLCGCLCGTGITEEIEELEEHPRKGMNNLEGTTFDRWRLRQHD